MEPDTDATSSVATANISRLKIPKMEAVWSVLLPRCFPSTAARYARRCAIPFPRSGVAVELAIGICTSDRYPHKPFAADAAGNICAGRRNLAVGDGKC